MTENEENINNINEFEIPVPQRSDMDITASNHGNHDNPMPEKFRNEDFDRDPENKKVVIEEKHDILSKDNKWHSDKPGFKIEESEKTDETGNKRGDNNILKERDDARDHKSQDAKSQDAKWQEDKINEANNQNGAKLNIDDKAVKINNEIDENGLKGSEKKAEVAKETREDSILNRPKTETYETNQGENVGAVIKNDNNTHSIHEKDRDDMNRKIRAKNNDKSEHTY